MTEEKINALRQTDANLRDALRMDETERPKMPADLNERLMQRMAVQKEKKPRRIVWSWIAAACVAGVMMIWLKPPASPQAPLQAEKGVVAQNETPKADEPKMVDVIEPASTPVKAAKKPVVRSERKLLAQETLVSDSTPTAISAANEAHADIAMAEKPQKEAKHVTLTERDIPITRPENYKYTPEEIALMKKQANEAYLKWAQLELEIAKYNLEQTAQSDF